MQLYFWGMITGTIISPFIFAVFNWTFKKFNSLLGQDNEVQTTETED